MSATAVRRQQMTAKVVVHGASGTGVRTLVQSTSDIDMIGRSAATSELGFGLEVGRMAVTDQLVIQLLALPRNPMYRALWPELETGALGAVIVIDGRAGSDGGDLIAHRVASGRPFGVFINRFDDHADLDLAARVAAASTRAGARRDVVVVEGDARDRRSSRSALVRILDSFID